MAVRGDISVYDEALDTNDQCTLYASYGFLFAFSSNHGYACISLGFQGIEDVNFFGHEDGLAISDGHTSRLSIDCTSSVGFPVSVA